MTLDASLFTHLFWLGLAITLIIIELIMGTNFFLLWIGVISGVLGGIVWIFPSIPWQYQVTLFSVASVLSIWVWRSYRPAKTDRPTLNRRAEHYIGRTFTLSEPIVNGRGKIKVDDSSWQVEGPDLPQGETVTVTGVDGVVLVVEPKH